MYCLLQYPQIHSPSESSTPFQKQISVVTDIFLLLDIFYSSITSAGLVNARRNAMTVVLQISVSLLQLAQHFLLVRGTDHAKKISTVVNFDVDMDDCKKLKISGWGG